MTCVNHVTNVDPVIDRCHSIVIFPSGIIFKNWTFISNFQ